RRELDAGRGEGLDPASLTVDDAHGLFDDCAGFTQVAGRQHDLTARRDHVLDDEDPLASDVAALCEAPRAVLLRLLPHEQAGYARDLREHHGQRHAAEFEASERVKVGWHEWGHGLRDGA